MTYNNMNLPQRRLYRSSTDKMLLGVCGGVAQYFGWDPAMVRIVTVLLAFVFNVVSPFLYLVAAMVMPREPRY
ncbi:PspC domain-containing protein [Corynebacterium sp. 13CS0277]|uniref:PspC domain-containing protein n=1 Tax=Corynebacterium sp. 13CS0277 TaxID=2071994 RepID=UPI0013048D6D|nr:PspC domain-containing protein [Corynebacterium sp. 13CS0277]